MTLASEYIFFLFILIPKFSLEVRSLAAVAISCYDSLGLLLEFLLIFSLEISWLLF